MNNFTFSTPVNSIDSAALLITLGFDLLECKVVNHINLNTKTHTPREINATWTFSKNSKYCPEAGSVSNVLKKFVFPTKGEKITNLYQRAKIAAHNYQVLKSVLVENKPLQQIQGFDYTIFKNSNGEVIPQDSLMNTYSSVDIASIAIAGALGCKLLSYEYSFDKLRVFAAPNKSGISLQTIESLKSDKELHNTNNFSVLPVLTAMFLNRKWLMDEIHNRNKSILISRGDRMVMFNKNTSDNFKEQALNFINQ